MSAREIFPFMLIGDQARVESTLSEDAEYIKQLAPAVTNQPTLKDFRPTSPFNRERKEVTMEVGGGSPKVSSATDDAESSPNVSPTSLVDLEALRASVERASNPSEGSGDGETPTTTTGSETHPAETSTPSSEETLISSSPLL